MVWPTLGSRMAKRTEQIRFACLLQLILCETKVQHIQQLHVEFC